ncbi:MAG: sulfite exporter TauE/SafE family protein [Bacteroidota bacterium]
MELVLALFSGLILGTLHAFDPDHIAAVTAFSSKHPEPRKAAAFGIAWGFGHSTMLILFGLAAVAFRFVIPPLIESVAEGLVGGLLVAIGIWVLADILWKKRVHIHRHTHDGVEHVHFHSHTVEEHHRHRHSMFMVGAAHGLAGTASVLVLIPLALGQSLITAAVYLLLFGLGTTIAMGSFAYLLGSLSRFAQMKRILPALQGTAGLASIGIGILWISNSLFA